MKFLIWLGCLIVSSVISTLISAKGGSLGFLPTVLIYAPAFLLAKSLCNRYDEKKRQEEENNDEWRDDDDKPGER